MSVIEYKSKKEKGKAMTNNKLAIDEKLQEGVHFKFSIHGEDVKSHVPGSINAITGSSMFAITVRPIGGLLDLEIENPHSNK